MQRAVYLLIFISIFIVGCGGDGVEAIKEVVVDENAPVLGAIGNKTVTIGATVSFTVTVTDPNNLSFTLASDGTAGSGGNPYSGNGIDASFTIDLETDTADFEWITTGVTAGNYTVEFSVINSAGFSDSEIIQITVQQQPGQFQLGETLYNDRCESCHGPEGRFGSRSEIQCVNNLTYFEVIDGSTIPVGIMNQYVTSWSTADKEAALFYLQNVDASRC